MIQSKSVKNFLIKINDSYKKIDLESVFSLEKDGKYVSIKVDDRTFNIRMSIKSMMDLLPSNFVRTHASFIVNSDKIKSINFKSGKVILSNTDVVPISKTFKSELMDKFIIG
jgi:DNA-binding LytR/AlgR family response regulator